MSLNGSSRPFLLTILALLLFSTSSGALGLHVIPTLKHSFNLTSPSSRCVHYADWTATQCNFKHCVAALHQVWMREKLYRGIKYEFCGRGQRPRTALEEETVPQMFKAGKPREQDIASRAPVDNGFRLIGSCTIAVVNTGYFPPRYLPGQIANPYFKTGIATYSEIFHAAEMILEQCEHIHCTAGWQPVGDVTNGLGIFVWATQSKMMTNLSQHNQQKKSV